MEKKKGRIKDYRLILIYENDEEEEFYDFPNGMNEDIREWLDIVEDNQK